MSKRRHNFGTKRFKEKSLFIFHARIALKSLILLFVRLIARGARIGKTHTQTDRHTDRQDKYCNPRACAPRVNYFNAVPLFCKLHRPCMRECMCVYVSIIYIYLFFSLFPIINIPLLSLPRSSLSYIFQPSNHILPHATGQFD